MVRIALATSGAVRQRTYTSWAGSLRWSTMTITSSWRSMVGSMRVSYRLFQQPGVEGQRQKLRQAHPAGDFGQVAEQDFDVAAILPEELAAGSARRRRVGRIGDHRNACERGVPLRERLVERDALGAHGQPVGGVLDIAPGDDLSAAGFERRADREAGIAGVGARACVNGGGCESGVVRRARHRRIERDRLPRRFAAALRARTPRGGTAIAGTAPIR